MALMRSARMDPPPKGTRLMWVQMGVATAAASLVGWVWQPSLPVQLVVLAVISLALLRGCAHFLDVTRTFPELLKVPLFKQIIGG